MSKARTVFFVSESTAITAESLGLSLLSQFPNVNFNKHRKPFINSETVARAFVNECELVFERDGIKPLVFATMADPAINQVIKKANCFYYEFFSRFISDIGAAIDVAPTLQSGEVHSLKNRKSYDDRMDVVNYTLLHDDAMTVKNISEADVILLGVSRSGKTPTCLYLALQFGIRAANYPLTQDDFENNDIPEILRDNKEKIVALDIGEKRLAEIRDKRRSGSEYASFNTCRVELNQARELFRRYQLPVFDTTTSSIEELSARIMQNIRRRTSK